MTWLRRIVIGIAVLAIGLWLANTSLFADTSAHRTKLIAHRRVHHVYAGTDRSNDACHAAPVEPIEHSLIQNTILSMREGFQLGAHAVEIDVHPTTDASRCSTTGRLTVRPTGAASCVSELWPS